MEDARVIRVLGRAGTMALLLMLALAAPAAANHVQCGDVITQDTTLDSDLACTGAVGLTIEGTGVALDLGGHSISGPGGNSYGIAIYSATDPGVWDGTIRGFGTGIDADGPDGLVVRDMLLEQNGVGLDCTYSDRCSSFDSTLRHNIVGVNFDAADGGANGMSFVRRNHAHDNETGFSFVDYDVTATDNRVERNSRTGVVIDYNAQVQMSRNLVAGNGEDGVSVSFLSNATIGSNRIERNGGNGVGVYGDHFFENTGAVVSGNHIARNAHDGVLVLADGAQAVVERNRTPRNGDDGIDVRFREGLSGFDVDVVVRANRADFNADLGIYAIPGTTDGGGNRAKSNGDPAQCVGVICK
jgi:Right handed beta helix region